MEVTDESCRYEASYYSFVPLFLQVIFRQNKKTPFSFL